MTFGFQVESRFGASSIEAQLLRELMMQMSVADGHGIKLLMALHDRKVDMTDKQALINYYYY